MSENATYYAEGYVPDRWWNDHRFPLVPRLRTHAAVKPKDKWDSGISRGFTFSWLFIKAWTLEHFSLSVEAVIDDHRGVGFVGVMPYLRWAITIPVPPSTFDFLRRKP